MKDQMRDAGCCTGMDVPEGTGVSRSSLERGFQKHGSENTQFPDTMTNENGDTYVPKHGERGGVVGRARGWER